MKIKFILKMPDNTSETKFRNISEILEVDDERGEKIIKAGYAEQIYDEENNQPWKNQKSYSSTTQEQQTTEE